MMKSYYYFLVILISLSFTEKLTAQIEEDSVFTEIDSILKIEVSEEKYVSSASKYDQTPEEAPSSISVITAEEIKTYGYQNLTELLNAQRGFYFSNDRTGDFIGVRGFGRSSDRNNRILLLLDGHRLNTYQVDYAPIGEVLGFNISNFERIEIVRGPGSTIYGNNAIHGVINLVMRKERDSFLPAIKLKYGTFDSKYMSLSTSKQITQDFSFSILGNYYDSHGENIYFKEFDKPINNNGLAENLDGMRYTGIYLHSNYKDLQLTGMLKRTTKQVPVAPYGTKFNAEQNHFTKSEFIDLIWSPRVSYNQFIKLNLSFDHQNYGSNLPYNLLNNDYKINFTGNTVTLGGDAQFIWDIFSNNRIIAGIEYKDNFKSTYDYEIDGSQVINDKWSYKLFSVFFQNEYQYNSNLSVYFGLRRDDFIGQEVSLNPRAGIVYSPENDHTFKLLYGRSFRAPNLLERNLEQKTVVGFIKNEELRSEFINTYEFIWNYNLTKTLKSNFSLYHYEMKDLIDQVIDPLSGFYKYVNIGQVNANGIEEEINYKLNAGTSYFRYSFQMAKNKDGSILTNSPEHLLKLGITNRIYSVLFGAVELNYESKRKTIYNEFTVPIFVININLFSERIWEYFSLSLSVKNLFNSTIRHPGGYELIQKTIIQPYRNYLFTLNIDL